MPKGEEEEADTRLRASPYGHASSNSFLSHIRMPTSQLIRDSGGDSTCSQPNNLGYTLMPYDQTREPY